MWGLTRWQIVMAVVAGLAAGALITGATYYVSQSFIDTGNDPQRQKHRSPADFNKPLGFYIPPRPQPVLAPGESTPAAPESASS